MTLLVTLRLRSPALQTAFESASDVTITVEQRTKTDDGALDLTAWAASEDIGAFEDGLDDDDTVARWLPIGWTDRRKLYRIRLTEEVSKLMDYNDWADGRMVWVSSERTDRSWVVNAFVGDRSVLQTVAAECEDAEVGFDLVRASEVDELNTRQFALTQTQAETLLRAFDRGLYSVPREVTLEELADPLDVSHQALSERLRRGVGSLIETTIAHRGDHGTSVGKRTDTRTDEPTEDLVLERPIALDV